MWQKAIRLNVKMEHLVIYNSFVALRGSKLLQSIKASSETNEGPNTILTAVQGGNIGINDVDLNSDQVVYNVNEENIAKSMDSIHKCVMIFMFLVGLLLWTQQHSIVNYPIKII